MPLATTYKEPPRDSAKRFAHFKAMDQQHCDSQFVSRCTIIAKCKIMYPLCIVWALLCVYSIFVFFVIWFQCTLSLGSTFDAWGSWICVAKCCCVPYNVLCCLVLAAFPVFCCSLNIALVDAWGNAPFGNVLLRTVFPVFLLGSVFLVFSLYSPLCWLMLEAVRRLDMSC